MSEEEIDIEATKAQPAAQALKRIVDDDDFREQVLGDAEAALASYDLSAEAVAALSADAEVLASEVAGFALERQRPPVSDEVVAQLRTPTILDAPSVIAPYIFCRVG